TVGEQPMHEHDVAGLRRSCVCGHAASGDQRGRCAGKQSGRKSASVHHDVSSFGHEGRGDSLDGAEWPRGFKWVTCISASTSGERTMVPPRTKASWLFSMLSWS